MQVEQLTKSFGKQEVVRNVSFHLEPGHCVALLGPNGAGKTTTLRMLAGLIRPTSGSIRFSEFETKDIREQIGYLPQHPQFHTWMSGKEFLVYVGRLARLSKNMANERALELLERVGLKDAGHKKIGQYSGGMKQRLGIAQAMIHKPKLLMLDEPVSALDPIGRRDVLNLMEELKLETTLLFSTHILSDAEEASDQLLLMHHGEIIESGSFTEVRGKHPMNKILLQLESQELQSYLEMLRALPFITEVTVKKESFHLIVDDMESARHSLLTLFAENNWPVVHFEYGRMSLEDLFMKVVNQHAVDDHI
ncbi:ABC transporter ATP-binding protein [Halobacillus campisalis]|uniref:ATP-binding cassette domain-containing protein n=1 Tax=Halobacillus campisalis TaxID=435909 RepID=A0ABW2K9N1_9BACI|nr:ABC transporter ATP-binding protein [Halobacillus campisalis]